MISNFNSIHGSAVCRYRRTKLGYIDLAVADFQDGKTLGGYPVLHCGSVVEPHVWKSRARPRCKVATPAGGH
jgi:hypothetical protein